jgi:signal peptidase I
MSASETESEGKALVRPRKPWVALLLGLLIFPGYGQIYNGRPKQGLTLALVYLSLLPVFLITWVYLSVSIILLVVFLTINLVVYITILIHVFRQCKRGDPGLPRRWYDGRFGIISVWFMIALIVLPRYVDAIRYFVQTYKIRSGSMASTLEEGDVFIARGVYAGFRPLQRGDIVVFKYPKDEKKEFVKRVIGLPEETVEVKEKAVYINGQKLMEPYAVHDTSIPDERLHPDLVNFGPAMVPKGEFFVMGDNRDHSLDSRFWGFVSLNKIKARAIVTYWSWDSDRRAVRWNRIGRPLDKS